MTATGISSIIDSNVAQTEKAAFDDAIFKSYLEIALRIVPGSSSIELSQKLRDFAASRGTQDVIQYKIVSRSQQDALLLMTMDITINDTFLKSWLQGQSLMTPLAMRPKVLLVITSRGPGPSERHEWWSTGTPSGYSPFESQLAMRLRNAGENIVPPIQHVTPPPSGTEKAVFLGNTQGVDLVITGLLTHKSTDAVTLDSRLDVSLIDPKTNQRLASNSIALKGTTDQRMMNELLITAVIDQIKGVIAKKIIAISPSINEKNLCIEEVRDNETYQAIISSLRSMESVSKVTVSSVQGHTICHTIQLRGNLKDIMESLRLMNVVSADMSIDGDTAYIKILNQ